MKSWNGMLFQTLSCRTNLMKKLTEPVDPQQALLYWALLGVLLGAVGCRFFPALAQQPLLTQGLAVSGELRTLWDVCRSALLPMLIMLTALLLCCTSAIGQPCALLVLLMRGAGAGAAAEDCFARFPLRDAVTAVSVLILPCAFLSILILIYALRRSLAVSNGLLRYLLRGEQAAEIRTVFSALCRAMLISLVLTLLCCGLHTVLIWLMNDRLLGGVTI